MAEFLQRALSSWRRAGGRLLPPDRTAPDKNERLAAVAARVDDAPGWGNLTGRPHEYDPASVQELYANSLEAWRKNPIAWRIIAITTDYVVGSSLSITSPQRRLNKFIAEFWNHPKNRLDLRLEMMCDELARSGDLFVLLFRNPEDGMSYIRFITKDRILRIETAPNDWETELTYFESAPLVEGDAGWPGSEPRAWVSPAHPAAGDSPAVMLHYTVNRPLGALLGESDLTTMLPWLQRYSRMLEDRVRLHWAMRAFLWMVTVPPHKIREKQEQYRQPPESGSIIIKDDTENWQAVTPQLHGADVQHDLRAVRGMIDAGSGYPPHWRGEAADANLATATAMQTPTERHLLRRQQYFAFMLMDILYQAYQRASEIGRARPLGAQDYARLFTVAASDVSRTDNEALARSAKDLAQGLQAVQGQVLAQGTAWRKLALKLFMKFAGEPIAEETLDEILGGESRPPAQPDNASHGDTARPPAQGG